MDTEQAIDYFKKALEGVAKGDIQSFQDWEIQFTNLLELTDKCLGDLCERYEDIKIKVQKITQEDITPGKLMKVIEEGQEELFKVVWHTQTLIHVMQKELSIDTFFKLGELMTWYRELKKEGNVVVTF